MRKLFLDYLPLCLLIFILASCFESSEKRQERTELEPVQKEIPKSAKVSKDSETIGSKKAKSLIPKVNLFLEISGGMAGFMPKGGAAVKATEFQARVASMLTDVNYNKTIQGKDFYFIREKGGQPQLAKEGYQHVLKTVSAGIANPALGTELPEMLEQILKESGKSNAVSVVISDFIYGPAVKSNFNIIPQLVQGALNEAQNKGLVISVFGDKSSFYGSFHPAVKMPKKMTLLSGTKIPYYIWVIGKQQDVLLFNKRVLKNAPAAQAHYGFTYTTPAYEALPKFNSTGIIFCSSKNPKGGCKSVTVEVQEGEPVEFEIGVNLSGIPTSLQAADYLKNNLKLTGKGFAASIIEVKKATSQTNANAALDKYSHFIRVKVTQLSSATSKAYLTLPEKDPAWINQWTTQNDNNPVAEQGKTFKLDDVLKGVENLYTGSAKNVFQLSITIIKNNE